jgi:phosphoenolpyruvate-protein phosphotransferase (PTS system enzyme I)
MNQTSFTLHGLAVSAGIAIGHARVLKAKTVSTTATPTGSPEEEVAKLNAAVNQAKLDVAQLRDKTRETLGAAKAEIFEVHLSLLNDPELIGQSIELINSEKISAVEALHKTSQVFIEILQGSGDEVLMGRVADLQDTIHRLTDYLIGSTQVAENLNFDREVIVVATDLTPSETIQFDAKYVVGLITEVGSATSHSSILARAMGIPSVVGVAEVSAKIPQDALVIIDGEKGELFINPDDSLLTEYKQKKQAQDKIKQEIAVFASLPSKTADGKELELAANIGRLEDLDNVIKYGADGVGLFRSEFSYLDRKDLPTEDELYRNYSLVLKKMGSRPVIIRTLDIGGDKHMPALKRPLESNPFLGVRALRLCLAEEDLFRTQLRALLRASVHGNLRIMFPMVALQSEIHSAKRILQEEEMTLRHKGVAVSDKIQIGIMLEIPAAVLMADQLIKTVDFFSIGTNDLVQYTMAADRMNEHLSYLQAAHHPAILRLIDQAARAVHQQGKWLGLCGEMGGDPVALPLLLGLGVHELSMHPVLITRQRAALSKIKFESAQTLAQRCLNLNSAEEVQQLVRESCPQLF